MKHEFFDSSVFQRLSSETQEILKLKWIESEKTNCDIGLDRAITIWVRFHRDDWIKENYEGNGPP
jgi:hypothetical protein